MNQKLNKQNIWLNNEKNELLKKMHSLETKLAKSDVIRVELNHSKSPSKCLILKIQY